MTGRQALTSFSNASRIGSGENLLPFVKMTCMFRIRISKEKPSILWNFFTGSLQRLCLGLGARSQDRRPVDYGGHPYGASDESIDARLAEWHLLEALSHLPHGSVTYFYHSERGVHVLRSGYLYLCTGLYLQL